MDRQSPQRQTKPNLRDDAHAGPRPFAFVPSCPRAFVPSPNQTNPKFRSICVNLRNLRIEYSNGETNPNLCDDADASARPFAFVPPCQRAYVPSPITKRTQHQAPLTIPALPVAIASAKRSQALREPSALARRPCRCA